MRAPALLIISTTAGLAVLTYWQPWLLQHAMTRVDDTVAVATSRVIAALLAGPSAALALSNDGRVIGTGLTEDMAAVIGVLASPLPSIMALMLVCAVVSGSGGSAPVFLIGLVMGLSALSEADPQKASELVAGGYALCMTLLLPRPAQMMLASGVLLCIGAGETQRLVDCASSSCLEALLAHGPVQSQRVGYALLCAGLASALLIPPALRFIYAELRLKWLRSRRVGDATVARHLTA